MGCAHADTAVSVWCKASDWTYFFATEQLKEKVNAYIDSASRRDVDGW